MWPISSRRQIQLSQPPEMPESSFSSKGKERKETRTHCRWEKNCFLPYSYSTTNQNKLDSCRWPAILSSVSEITSHFGLHIGLGALSLAKELQSFCPDHIQEAPTLSLKGICNKQKQKQKKGGGEDKCLANKNLYNEIPVSWKAICLCESSTWTASWTLGHQRYDLTILIMLFCSFQDQYIFGIQGVQHDEKVMLSRKCWNYLDWPICCTRLWHFAWKAGNCWEGLPWELLYY